jgi:hypothetical protein
MRKLPALFAVLVGAIVISSTVVTGCGDNGGHPANSDGPPADAPRPPDGSTPDADCYNNPQSYLQIINACTTAQKVAKSVTIPGILPDGGLPQP